MHLLAICGNCLVVENNLSFNGGDLSGGMEQVIELVRIIKDCASDGVP